MKKESVGIVCLRSFLLQGDYIMEHKIITVQQGSIAQELEIEPGDSLLSINGKEIKDVFDYQYYCNEEYLTVLIRKVCGEEWELEIEKEYE